MPRRVTRSLVVRAGRVLQESIGDAADVPYEETSLAKRAPAARRRLAALLAVGAIALAVEAFASSWPWALAALFAMAAAWRTRAGRLDGLIAAGLAAALAAFLPLAFIAFVARTPSTVIALAVSFILGAAALPDVVLLMRDAELQNAYGIWARREGDGAR